MFNFIKKIKNFIKIKIIKYFVLKSKISYKKKFELIYNSNYWSSPISRSGTGSTLENTKNIRNGLQNIINQFQIKTILDIPCGDFLWMKYFLENNPQVNYIGGDIVSDLIVDLSNSYSSKTKSFIEIDIIKDRLPSSDLLFCRDCFMHFSNEDILKSLRNFLKSNIKFLIASNSTQNSNFFNKNISTGEYREINLFLHPFNLPKDNLVNLTDVMNTEINQNQNERKMSMWSREQISNVIKSTKV